MLRVRIMPVLLLQGRGAVKTTRFKKALYVGDIINTARIFNQMEVDELIIFDIESTAKKTAIKFELIERIVSECFMPICYGGGVRSLDDFRKLFYLGIEKVAVGSLIFSDPDTIKKAVSLFGAQSIVVVLDIKKGFLRKRYTVTTHNATRRVDMPLETVLVLLKELGVGEVIINNVDREGTWEGFDNNLVSYFSSSLDIPVVAVGGGGALEHIQSVVKDGHASAVGLGSMAVFQAKGMGVLIKFPKARELECLLK
ncbi:imidazole glycerol phosphate synthase subunit HisF [Pseudomonas sp. o96-267]|uniref:HisA/HisF-related TIM barrel protein n=1 Tax=Pseudomonas sp. o96-267 TaxID=2479853 RepID=UPI000F7AFE41|nr:HisA/HisF-related TIM barrel protein [Pseudomonas sp. o96-267]RRV29809.1 imidazole glycerol phosphate synthase subunit HisF [Pseudomonas sp. o96-267]